MSNLCLALLIFVLCASHFQVPIRLIGAVQRAQSDFDAQIFLGESCRSNFEDLKERVFSFSQSLSIPCYFERIDYGANKAKDNWPQSICLLQEKVNTNPTIGGEERCNYQ
jgi:hypothetical protein